MNAIGMFQQQARARGRIFAVAIATLLMACGHAQVPTPARSRLEARHRPLWLGWIATAVDMISLCEEGREGPVYVALVVRSDTTAADVITVDAYQEIEHCGVDQGRVVLRQPGREMLSAYEGMPLFSLGPVRPVLKVETVMEEVLHEGKVLGWIHWPSATPSSNELAFEEVETSLP